jgi:hypothetical protein
LWVIHCPRKNNKVITFLDFIFKKFLSAYLENMLNGEKIIKTEHTVYQLIMAKHEKFFGSFISVLDGFGEAKKPFHAAVPLKTQLPSCTTFK